MGQQQLTFRVRLTLDTYDNPSSDGTHKNNNGQHNANDNANGNASNANSDVDFDPEELMTDDDDDDNDEDESGFGIHRSVNLVEHIDKLSESGGDLNSDDGIHNDFTNASLDNRDNSLLDEMDTNGSENDRSTHDD